MEEGVKKYKAYFTTDMATKPLRIFYKKFSPVQRHDGDADIAPH